ncbi:MAG: branched-chain amino acid transporter permease [Jatrophihabitantaceae bacterium]|nr:branched-chain amino acid transporter permease [Jatrophihabitantaceae bacterium]
MNPALAFLRSDSGKRLGACLGLGVALALMTGATGRQDDYLYAIKEDLFTFHLIENLLIGVVVWLLFTFWPVIRRYLTRPGALGLLAGAMTVIVAQTVLGWYEPEDAKFSGLATLVGDTNGIFALSSAFFGWLAWAQLIAVIVVGAAALVLRNRALFWVGAAMAVAAAIIASQAHKKVDELAGVVDHATGVTVAVWGYLTIAVALAIAAISTDDVARTREFVNAVLGWRPGFALGAAATALALYSLGVSSWFAPKSLNATLADVHSLFKGTSLAPIAVQYFIWLSWALVIVAGALVLVAAYFRSIILGIVGAAAAAVGLVITMISIHAITSLAANSENTYATKGPWQNLGDGAWWTCASFLALAAAGLVVAQSALKGRSATAADAAHDPSAGPRFLYAPGATLAVLGAAAAAAIFIPPTLEPSWQTALVTSIGIYMFLAIGLNVVVGWAGLLDLGFIAFYAIGAYTTAYLVGSLPVKPPFELPVLWAIPFAIAVCLIAGVILGFPTLRLRGDYLAIVTLGFGEIVRLVAVNSNGITNGPRGTEDQVPHPVINLGFVKFTFGLDQLPYWYLLLAVMVIVIIFFRRLENSRTGRAWAAIREDEVAAQAAGINPVKYKLLAFAIGASTSGIAGVLFATNVGFFNPDNFKFEFSILVLAYVVFGGMGSLPGAIAGAAVLTWLPEFLRDQVPS